MPKKLQLRYGGCHGCLTNCKATLKMCGLRAYYDYDVCMHDEFKNDPVYKNHPEYLSKFTGAILINTENHSHINMYPDGEHQLKYSRALEEAIEKLKA